MLLRNISKTTLISLLFPLALGALPNAAWAQPDRTPHWQHDTLNTQKSGHQHRKDRLIVKLKATTTTQAIASQSSALQIRAAQFGGNKVTPLLRKSKKFGVLAQHNGLDRIYVIDVAPTQLPHALLALSQDSSIEYVTTEALYHASLVPNDTYYHTTGTWGQTYSDLWGLQKIQSGNAWDQSQGSQIIVAVVDTGIDANHPELQGQLWQNPAEIAGNNLDDDGNGFIDDTYGWNFVTQTNTPSDGQGHGTHVSGTIAAKGGNGTGIIGVAPQAKIMVLKGLGDDGTGSETDLAAGIIYAADQGAHIINCSFGGTSSSPLMTDAVNYAYQKGAVIVAAAGNEGGFVTPTLQPAGVPTAITVAATDAADTLAGFSNWGLKIDVAAPGVDILSLLANNSELATSAANLRVGTQYLRLNGTSMAAPHVAGLVAQLLAKNPSLTPAQVRYLLRNQSDDLSTVGFDLNVGYGRINALRAVNNTAAVPHIEAFITDHFSAVTGAGTVIHGSAKATNFNRYTISYSRSDNVPDMSTLTFTEFKNSTTPISNDTLGALPTNLTTGIYLVRLRVYNASGAYLDEYARVRIDANLKTGWSQSLHSESDFSAAAAYADLDGDNQLEVVALSQSQLHAWKANGTYLSGFPVNLPFVPAETPIVVADLDKDSKPEIIVGFAHGNNNAGIIAAYRNNGSLMPGFPAGKIAGKNTNLFSRIVAGDIDGDGKPELIAVAQTQYENAFSNERYLIALDASGSMKTGWPKLSTNEFSYTNQFAVADLDKDGKREILVAANRDANRLMIYRGDGSIRNEITQFVGVTDLGVGDLNSDGNVEILFRTAPQISGGSHQIYVTDTQGNTITGWPKSITTRPSGPGRMNTQLFMADIDSNGDQELVAPTVSHIEAYNHDGSVVSGYPLLVVTDTDGQIGGPVVLAHTATSPQATYIFGSQARMPGTSISSAMMAVGANGQSLNGWPKALSGGRIGDIPVIGDLENDGKLDIGYVRPQYGLIDGTFYLYEVAGAGRSSACPTVYCGNQRDAFMQRPAGAFAHIFPQLHLRGTHNNWGNAAMALVADNTWEADVNFGTTSTERFKFDVNGDWSNSYGDTQRDGIAEPGGADISVTQGAGTYRIRFNDSTRAYSVTKQGNNNSDLRRTVIFMYGQTVVGQDMFLRGGIDWTYAKNNLGRDCAVDKWLCALPITHNQFQSDPNRSNDKYLDWHGAEAGQNAAIQGSPLVWTTNNASNPKKVATDGYGYTPLNKWGDHYWMLDVQMDCSKGVKVGNDTWIELKSYISNGPGWEANVTQAGAPYSSGNHFAKCGWLNKFERGSSSVYFEPLL
jgi:subtilisin family serine protease